MKSVSVLITCHNRRETTLRCLQNLFAQCLPPGVELRVFLVDDGCTDGTGDAVSTAWPSVSVICGDGTLFWCGGMRLAWTKAAADDPDFYLWLNDDVVLEEHAIRKLLDLAACPETGDRPGVVVGSCCDPDSGEYAYGGQIRPGLHPGKLDPVFPGDEPVSCDTFEGNIVLVSREVFRRIGNLTPFRHTMGDIDYGLRVGEAGIRAVVAPRYLGRCRRDAKRPPTGMFAWRTKLRACADRLSPGDWFRFLWRHAGVMALLYWGRPYLHACLRGGRHSESTAFERRARP